MLSAFEVSERVDDLIRQFPHYLACFNEGPPFRAYGQLEFHLRTLDMRRELGSALNAISSDAFLESLYETLKAWRIGSRGSRLHPLPVFNQAIRAVRAEIAELDGLVLGCENPSPEKLSRELWSLIQSLDIVDNQVKVVACTKALHHILPLLVVPIDRTYTARFFGWEPQDVQWKPKEFFYLAFHSFARVARNVPLETYLTGQWCSCHTKLVDNAIVGYCLAVRQ